MAQQSLLEPLGQAAAAGPGCLGGLSQSWPSWTLKHTYS
jgi:hypothetical protein